KTSIGASAPICCPCPTSNTERRAWGRQSHERPRSCFRASFDVSYPCERPAHSTTRVTRKPTTLQPFKAEGRWGKVGVATYPLPRTHDGLASFRHEPTPPVKKTS